MGEQTRLEMKHVAELLTLHFNIPSYQRGYRWEKKHVENLLDDLLQFSQQTRNANQHQGVFYCMQPLAVVPNTRMTVAAGHTVYDVIDGQQRLTTLYLILSYLEDARRFMFGGSLADAVFTLTYESRNSQFFENEEYKSADVYSAIDNIDFFYMTRAYRTIAEWFDRHGSAKANVLFALIPQGFQPTDGMDEAAAERARQENDKRNDVRFIWYVVPAKESSDSIEVFSQLNYGKTPLTSTELVKALLFQSDLYTDDVNLMQEITFRRSCEWDGMEKQLQDPFMWSMLMDEADYQTSHIGLILSLVCSELYSELPRDVVRSDIDKENDDFVYQVFNAYLGTNEDGKYAQRVEDVWRRIQMTYTALYNWFKSPDVYHLTGLLLWLRQYKARNYGKTQKEETIRELMTEYKNMPTNEFEELLMRRIAQIIQVPTKRKTKEGEVKWGLDYINYNDNAIDLVRILVVHNVEQIRKEQNEQSRFPFHLLKKFNITSLEHIHPQNLVMDNIETDTIRQWLDSKEASIDELDKKQLFADDFTALRLLCKDKETYTENKVKVNALINKIDKEFDDLANMSDAQMHTLYNMALVDKETNSALSNKLLNRKRNVLIERQRAGETYAMPATRRALSKYYTKPSKDSALVELWTKKDREAYFQSVKEVYDSYVSLLNKESHADNNV